MPNLRKCRMMPRTLRRRRQWIKRTLEQFVFDALSHQPTLPYGSSWIAFSGHLQCPTMQEMESPHDSVPILLRL